MLSSPLQSEKKILRQTENLCEFQYVLTNPTDQEIYLDEFDVFSADSPEALGLEAGDCLFMRTGRHKNDMPSIARFGVIDACMQDAMGGMTESGDRASGKDGCRTILSDHFTLLGSGSSWVMLSFVTARDQLFRTEIAVDENGCFAKLRSCVEFRIFLRPGQTIQTEIFRLEHTSQPMAAIDRLAQDKAALYGSRAGKKPSVFCTWYYYGLTVTWQDVKTNLEKIEQYHLPFDVFQIDEGWESTLGQWEPNQKFPLSMKEAAQRIRQAGLTPGIWTSPFVASAWADVWKEHPEWMLRDQQGNPCLFPMNDTTYCVFDITHPGTWQYFEKLYHKLTFDWGYPYHKLDFTRAAVIYENAAHYDKHITLAQAYYQAVSAIRRGMGEDSYFLMCGGLYDPIIGLVDAQRTGSDVLSMWASSINKGGKTAPYTIKQSLLRYYMNQWWDNDPDALMVRRSDAMERGLRLTYGLLTDDEVKTVTLNQFISGGLVCTTEPLDKIEPDRMHQIRHVLPPVPLRAEPADLLDGQRFPAAVRITFPDSDAICYALINWDDHQPRSGRIPLDADLPAGRYAISDFFSGHFVLDVRPGDEAAFADIPPHGAALIKVEPLSDKPVVLASDAHFAMRGEFEYLIVRDGCLCWKLKKGYDHPAHYRVWIPSCAGQAERVVSLNINGFTQPEGKLPL